MYDQHFLTFFVKFENRDVFHQNHYAMLLTNYTAIPYRASTGPEQGFPSVVFPHRENPVFITGFPGDENRFFPVGNTTQGKPCFHYRDGFAFCNVAQIQIK